MVDFAPRTFDEMIAAGRFDLVRPGVNPTAFPLDPERFSDLGLQIIGFTGPIEIGMSLTAIQTNGWPAAQPEQLLAYVASHPEAHLNYAIVALGAAGLDPRQPPSVLRVRHLEGKRVLETRPYKGMLETYERLLVRHRE